MKRTATGRRLRRCAAPVLPVALLLSLRFLVGCAACQVAGGTERAHVPCLAEFDIPPGADILLVPVEFGGTVLQFALDTGAADTVVDASLRDRLGESVGAKRGETADGIVRLEYFASPEAHLGASRIAVPGPAACADLGMFRMAVGQEIKGIVGMSSLRAYVLRLDFDRGKICLFPPDDRAHPEWGERIPIAYDSSGLPRVSVRLGDRANRLMHIIDTGMNSSGMLPRALFDLLQNEQDLPVFEGTFTSLAGTVRHREARFDTLELGSFEYRGLILHPGSHATLGLSFLCRHVVTFDFPNKRLYLKKGKRFHERDELDMSGLHLLRVSGETVVHSVDEGSPAKAAGIKAEDVILKISGNEASEMEMWTIRKVLKSGDGREIRMKLNRGGEVVEVSFRLKRRL